MAREHDAPQRGDTGALKRKGKWSEGRKRKEKKKEKVKIKMK